MGRKEGKGRVRVVKGRVKDMKEEREAAKKSRNEEKGTTGNNQQRKEERREMGVTPESQRQ